MISSPALPTWTFVAPDGSVRQHDLAACAAEIDGMANVLNDTIERGSAVGLIYRSGPQLVKAWLACLVAGLEPLVVQYPTTKQSQEYWLASLRSVLSLTQLRALVVDDDVARIGFDADLRIVAQAELAAARPGRSEFVIGDFSILQLSSGTTGHRKAIRFTGEQLRRHVVDYNRTLALDPATDRIVSWLPLYHDMGYIACFVMPLILGVPVTMIDPMTWIAQPDLLFDAVERDGGTVCYMPNFGFEVMARQPARPFPSMRHWVSCSEPTAPATARRFMAQIGAELDRFASCYAMAENVFAVSFRAGLRTLEREGIEVASCGAPIAGVDLKLDDDGQIWVRSPASLAAYVGGTEIVDADGFYPTGDLGSLDDGELFVAGRKQDVLIQAGRKFMLSDIDLALNRIAPDVRGRGVAVQVFDERLGTQKPLVLIESKDFLVRDDAAAIEAALKSEFGLDQVEIGYVPPRFLTKTSSGKFNRKISAQHWLDAKAFQAGRGTGTGAGTGVDPVAELKRNFARLSWSQPVSEVMDSLSSTLLRIIIADAGLRYQPALSLQDYADRLSAAAGPEPGGSSDTLYIVSIADRDTLSAIDDAWIETASKRLGKPIVFEHICLPPTPILLSDIAFNDWFQCRLDQTPFTVVTQTLDKLRRASIVLTDDKAELHFALRQVYGVLSHGLRRDPRADLVTVRWQRYPQFHDKLPLTVVAGRDLGLADRAGIHRLLERAIGAPLFRLAMNRNYAEFTKDWEFHPAIAVTNRKADGPELLSALMRWIEARDTPLRMVAGNGQNRRDAVDLAHYCSSFANRALIEKALDRYDRFVIVGQTSSIPYLRQEIQRRGKRFQYANSYAPEVLGKLEEPYDCVLSCGSMGDFVIEGPAIAIMATGDWNTRNIDDVDLKDQNFHNAKRQVRTSDQDWFYPFALGVTTEFSAEARAAQKLEFERKRARKAEVRRKRGGKVSAAREERLLARIKHLGGS